MIISRFQKPIRKYPGIPFENCTFSQPKINYAIPWTDILNYGLFLPEHCDRAKALIEKNLGYLPPHKHHLTFEINIREAIECFERFGPGKVAPGEDCYTQQDFDQDIYNITRRIRNDDMHRGWGTGDDMEQEHIKRYNSELMPYISGARDRLAKFLGYYPQLKHSLQAEIFLRGFLAFEDFDPCWEPSVVDYKAMTIVKFREAYFKHGLESAQKSPLLGFFNYAPGKPLSSIL